MRIRKIKTYVALAAISADYMVSATVAPSASGAPRHGATLDWAAVPGENYADAQFRLWLPTRSHRIRYVLVLTPGSNADGRSMVADARWQAFAVRHEAALVGSRMTDKPHADMSRESYAQASRGSGQALIEALNAFADKVGNRDVARAPLLLWGFSAGGQFNYEFLAWKPDRVAGFVVNKGGVYYSGLLSATARIVPGLLILGTKDLDWRKAAIQRLFAINRQAGARWSLVEESGVGHEEGRSRDMAEALFRRIASRRLPP
ncbi:hypothetical protein [Methylobacterium nodulans]|uniref:Uncharacterized protein n=1 Tax=Methylobacterium nodulans (strain LMG 21967 / CNCM I-2342 / ORS 2060) TaxID=460265 RepID=B8IUI6_METNO|nr:hypothetical protein [Methylobacterium nodulans]ACL57054.1 hypothetical protein Mnod_2069 [Methylobacterium nodulans ORS 2060]